MREFYIILILIFSLFVSGCGGNSKATTSKEVVTGRVVDGEIKDATIFFDINKNGTLDNGEPSAKSDSEGRFMLFLSQEQIADYSTPIVSTGGFDIRANAKYEESLMAFRQKGENSVILTPISTLVAYDVLDSLNSSKMQRVLSSANIDVDTLFAKLADAQQKFADLFELDVKLLTTDPINLALENNNRTS
jgi:hypothetical protein